MESTDPIQAHDLREQVSPRRTDGGERVWFAQMLRGVAVLSVLGFHYIHMFFGKNAVVAGFIQCQPLTIDPDLLFARISRWCEAYQLSAGAFGVAVFFLVSGFVIPFSLESSRSSTFLIKRFFRIYLPYAVGLTLTCLALAAFCSVNGVTFRYSLADIAANLSLFRDLIGAPSIDGISWTLELEVKFYLVCALACCFSTLRNPLTLLCIGGGLLLAALATASARSPATCLMFMFLGTCFYNRQKSNWSLPVTACMMSTFSGAFVFLVFHGPFHSVAASTLLNFFAAFAVFGACYVFQRQIPHSRILEFFATVSYPLYLVHGVLGYILLTIFVENGASPAAAVAIVTVLATGLAYVIHRFVELPANRLGKQAAALAGERNAGKGLRSQALQSRGIRAETGGAVIVHPAQPSPVPARVETAASRSQWAR